MNREEINSILKELICAVSEADGYSSNMDLSDDLGLSSIDIMSLLTACEKKFSVKIPAKQLRMISTADDLADYIESKQ
ncbi:MAG: acyl carrier protein [Acutalibacteraceae bacterium]|jgi:acyl carrier protein|nr:acyl carrier protein [Acutalibacteraceae bacterium]